MARIRVRGFVMALVAVAAAVASLPPAADAACCYFAAKDRDILQPA
jgi:hypothetical protein